MKKQYEQPKAEKMEFDYEETVVASRSLTEKAQDLCMRKPNGFTFDGNKSCEKLKN